MIGKDDLDALLDAAPVPGVSIFLPTHERGAEIRQDPIRLKNLLAEAKEKLQSEGADAAILAPAEALVEDYGYWQHQSKGLALFLDAAGMRAHKLPFPVEEEVFVGDRFLLRPLLPIIEPGESFRVLTVTGEETKLFVGGRFAIREEESDLPQDTAVLNDDPDYENPTNVGGANRPVNAPMGTTNSQVYGDSPEDWRKSRQVEFLRRLGSAVGEHAKHRRLPLVVVGDAQNHGNLRAAGGLDDMWAGTVEKNPDALDPEQLHEAAMEALGERLGAERRAAAERLAALVGSGDQKGVTKNGAVMGAAGEGRVEALLVAADAPRDERTDEAIAGTLRTGGAVHMAEVGTLPGGAKLGAILRY